MKFSRMKKRIKPQYKNISIQPSKYNSKMNNSSVCILNTIESKPDTNCVKKLHKMKMAQLLQMVENISEY